MRKGIQDVMGVDIFTYGGFDNDCIGGVRYDHVHFIATELTKYNTRNISVVLEVNGNMSIYGEKDKEIEQLNVGDLQSFRDSLLVV